MKIEVKDYTYETMPEYTDVVEGAKIYEYDLNHIYVDYIPDIIYDIKDGHELHLQILMPKIFNKKNLKFPGIIYVQGSAWMKQDCYRDIPNLSKLAARGYVIAIVEYRHSGIAKFPCPIIDAKNATRFMKANAEIYNMDKNNVFMMGNSSGGHVSSMAGMTSRTNLFDDPINDETLDYKGIIDLYGSVELTLEYGFPTTVNHQLPDSPEGMEMGWNIREHMEETEIANSKTYAGYDFPPMLIMHGTKDKTVFAQESVNLYEACKKAGNDVQFYLVKGSDHGGPGFVTEGIFDIYEEFFQYCMEK
ncbi:MAG: alpha/beta hydrolase [Holdemanella sp.]|nr:alpha/beta hydrolase [Holdemanella sp.]